MDYNFNNILITPAISNAQGTDVTFKISGLSNDIAAPIVNLIRMGILTYTPKYVPIIFSIPTLNHILKSVTGVNENGVEIEKRIKQIKIDLKGKTDALPEIITLSHTSEVNGELHLRDLQCEEIENTQDLFINPDLVLLTTTQPEIVSIKIKLRLTYMGEGYQVTNETNVGELKINSGCNPVENIMINFQQDGSISQGEDTTKVSGAVLTTDTEFKEDIPIKGMTTCYMRVKTDGTIMSSFALNNATAILASLFAKMGGIQINTSNLTSQEYNLNNDYKLEEYIKNQETALEDANRLYQINIPIDEYNQLKDNQINSLRDIVVYSGDKEKINNIRKNIIEQMEKVGLIVEDYEEQLTNNGY